MKIEEYRENNKDYLCIECAETVRADYQMKMVVRNTVKHLLAIEEQIINNQRRYLYCLEKMQPLGELFSKNAAGLHLIKEVLAGLAAVQEVAKEYLLDLDAVLLNPEYIYVNRENEQIFFVYAPMDSGTYDNGICKLFEYFLEQFSHANRNETILFYELYHKVTAGERNPKVLLEMADGKSVQELRQDMQQKMQQGMQQKMQQGMQQKMQQDMQQKEDAGESGKEETWQSEEVAYEIPTVAKEIVESEVETENKVGRFLLRLPSVLAYAVIVVVVIELMVPNVLPIQLELIPGLAVIGVMLLFGKLGQLFYQKNKECCTRMKKVQEEIPYCVKESEMMHCEHAQSEIMHNKIQDEKEKEAVTELLSIEKDTAATVLLSDFITEQAVCRLVAVGEPDKQIFLLQKFPSVIGSSMNKADVCIVQPCISRLHARISREQGEYLLQDLLSTNGTFLNGVRLNLNEKYTVNDGDLLRFANCEYRFHML